MTASSHVCTCFEQSNRFVHATDKCAVNEWAHTHFICACTLTHTHGMQRGDDDEGPNYYVALADLPDGAYAVKLEILQVGATPPHVRSVALLRPDVMTSF